MIIKRIRRIIISFIPILLLTSCNDINNKIIIDDLTVSKLKEYSKIYLKDEFNVTDLNNHYISLTGYFNKINGIYPVLTFEYGTKDKKEIFLDNKYEEQIEEYNFNYKVRRSLALGRVFINNHSYTLKEAYENKLLTLNEVKSYHEIYRDFMNNYNFKTDYYYIYKFQDNFDIEYICNDKYCI